MLKTSGTRHFVACTLVLGWVVGPWTLSPAIARGFCNIDKLGKLELRREIANAGAIFLEGGSHLMEMLAALERNDSVKGKMAGSQAITSFSNAGALYKTAADKVSSEIGDDKFSIVKLDVVAVIGQMPQATSMLMELAKIAQSGKASANFMRYCAAESERMRAATNEFLKSNQDQEKTYATLLSAWTRALDIGRTVSAFFAAAGGEK